MKVVAILQARIGSTRLKNKIMLPLAGRPMIEQIYNRVKRATELDSVIVAIPKGTWNDMRDAYIPFNDFFLFDGDQNDLVARYLACAKLHQADIIVRIPCDNPCVDPLYIDAAVASYMNADYTFYTNTTEYAYGRFIDGIGCEVFSVSRLKWLDARTVGNARWREHPHTFFYDTNAIDDVPADLRLDVNTQADYEFIKGIYDQFGHNHFTTEQVIQYLDAKKHS